MLRRLAKAEARIQHDALASDARSYAAAARSARKCRTPRPRHPGNAGPPAWCAARPACASGRPRRRNRRPHPARPARAARMMSLIIAAPAAIARRITSGLQVSTDTGTGSPASLSSTGRTRRSSSSARHGAARRDATTRRRCRGYPRLPRSAGWHDRNSLERIEEPAAVRKGIRRHVDHAHDQRPLERKRKTAELQDGVEGREVRGAEVPSRYCQPSCASDSRRSKRASE